MIDCPKCNSKITRKDENAFCILSFGSDQIDLHLKKVQNLIGVPNRYFKKVRVAVKYSTTFWFCNVCKELQDVTGNKERAKEAAEKELLKKIIDDLVENGHSEYAMDRCLRLSFGTIKKWRLGQSQPVSLPLMKLVRTFPFLLELADSNFDSDVAKRLIIEEWQRLDQKRQFNK